MTSAQVLRLAPASALNLHEHVAAEINAEIGRRRVTRTALATAVGVTGPTLSKRLNGQQPMTVDFIEQVCRVLDIDASRLFGWSPAPEPPTPGGQGVQPPRQDSNLGPADYKNSTLGDRRLYPVAA